MTCVGQEPGPSACVILHGVWTTPMHFLVEELTHTENLVDICGSYDDFSGLCYSNARLSSLLLYFAGHDAI